MKFIKLSIVHFNPLEKYPPVMNILRYLSDKNGIRADAYSVVNSKKDLFKVSGIRIYRTAILSKEHSSIMNYFEYFRFNILTVLLLIIKRPNVLLCYETISIFPAYVYKKLFPSAKLFIHFHEYTSLSEYNETSPYIKWLFRLERKLYTTADWISHTNLDRLNFFRTDHATVKFRNLEVMPNYPPEIWYKEKTVKDKISAPIKFVYVGALSLDSMYTREFAEWIKGLKGKAIWDIYSGNYQENALQYLEELNCPSINFKGEVEYFDLVKILNLYDVGVILYNGYIPNHIYSVPNKLFEYHACNLDVWFSEDIKGSLPYVTKDTYPKIIAIDFSALNAVDLSKAIEREGYSFHQGSFYYEDVLRSIKNKLLEID